MEDVFNSLKAQGKNNLEGIVEWMKEAKIIDGKAVTEEKVRSTFGEVSGAVEIDKFKEVMAKLAVESKSTVDSFFSKFRDTGAAIEGAFEKLKKDGKDNVDGVIQWMKDSKLISSAKESEEKARKLLSDVKDKQHVALEEFKKTVHKMAEDSEKGLSELMNATMQLVKEEGPRLIGAFQAASSAFRDALNK